jgi:uncharacterized protein YndB with AHSA1/START domain
MKRSDYQPGDLAEVSARADGERWTLVFVRELRHPPRAVWSALTDPAALAQWAPFDADRDLGRAGAATLTMAGGDGTEVSRVEVRRAEAPHLLEYTWDEDVLRWELEPIATGTRLTLRHTVADQTWIPRVAAGWHVCLDVADRMLAGDPVGRIVGEAAKQHGWQRLHDAYAARLPVS